jgi:RNA polymerase sigma-70 factor (ECF subfamily)
VTDVAASAFRRHYGQIYRFVRRRAGSREDAEDVTQDVFVAAAAGLDDFKPGATPVLAWLYTVAQRRLADEARRSARLAAAQPPLPPASPNGLAYGAEVGRALRAALGRLPEPQRRIVAMKLLEGRTFADIAARLDTTEAAAKMRLARALARLRDELAEEGIEP